LDNFVDRVSQWIRGYDRFVPDRVLSGFAIEMMPMSVDVNIEFKSDIAIQAREDHAARYHSSPDFGAFDRLEFFENFIEYDRRAFREMKAKDEIFDAMLIDGVF
jgi:hypothetical protein